MLPGSEWCGTGGALAAKRASTSRPPLPTLMAMFALFCLLALSSICSRLRLPPELGGSSGGEAPAPEPLYLPTRATAKQTQSAPQHIFPVDLTLELVRAVNADPSLLSSSGFPLTAFAPAPWLLPPRALHPSSNSNTASYDLLDVTAARARIVSPTHPPAIAVAFMSAGMLRMLQNAIYSMVKFGGVDNYIVVTWTPEDLNLCLDLNLPCADAAAFLPDVKGTSASHDAAFVPEFETLGYNRIMWIKPAVVKALLQAGYVVLSTDVDLSYTSKNVWDSYLSFMTISSLDNGSFSVDAAFQSEQTDVSKGSPINSGNYVALPTPGSLALFEAWMGLVSEKVGQGGNQKGLQALYTAGRFRVCDSTGDCTAAVAARNASDPVAFVRAYKPPWWVQVPSVCALQDNKDLVIDPCSPALLYLHPICTPRGDRVALKTEVLQRAGFWFMNTERQGGCPRGQAALARASPLGFALRQAGYQAVDEETEPERCLPTELLRNGAETAVVRCAEERRLAFV